MFSRTRLLLRCQSRRFSTSHKSEQEIDLIDKFTNAVGTKILLGGSITFVGFVTMTDWFPNTREGFQAGLRYEPSKPSVWFFELISGGLGLSGGAAVTNTYMQRRSLQKFADPLLLGLRLPYGVLGGMIGACSCFALSDHLIRLSTKVGKTVGYSVEGLLLDLGTIDSSFRKFILGSDTKDGTKEESKSRSWDSQNEIFDNSTWGMFNGEETSSNVENSRTALKKSRAEIQAEEEPVIVDTTTATTTATTTQDKDQIQQELAEEQTTKEMHINNLVDGLSALRRKEKLLRDRMNHYSMDPTSAMAQSIQVEILKLGDEKKVLKEEGMTMGVKLSKMLNQKRKEQVDELSKLRMQQEQWALIVADRHQDNASKREAMSNIRHADLRKAKLKKEFGKEISGLAVKRMRWKKTIDEAAALDLRC